MSLAHAAALGLDDVFGSHALADGLDVVLCRKLVRQLAGKLGFSVVGQTKLETAASELARNAIKYGGGGEMRWEALGEGLSNAGLRLTFEDHGPGIADLDAAMRDGYTTGKGLGMGLPGSKRLVEFFEIASSVGKGTIVTVARWR